MSVGSLYVSKATTKSGWRLMREFYENGLRRQETVTKLARLALGFADHLTLEEARALARQLNKQNAVEKERQRVKVRAAKRLETDQLLHSAFMPKEISDAFVLYLEENISGGEKHKEKILLMWNTARRVITALELKVEALSENKKKVYRYFQSKEYSIDYVKKLLRLINMFGAWHAKQFRLYFEPIPMPKGHDREMIQDAYLDSDSYFGPSDPLTPDELDSLKERLKTDQYNWLYLTVWLGLRPSEVNQCIEDRQQRFWRIEEGDTDVLWVYQPKLTSKPRAQRWKPIPILYPEQEEALTILLKGEAKPPLTRTLKRLTGRQVTLYAGRKGFTDLMLSKGQRLEDIAQWMGHSSIEMTWNRYKDKKKVHFIK